MEDVNSDTPSSNGESPPEPSSPQPKELQRPTRNISRRASGFINGLIEQERLSILSNTQLDEESTGEAGFDKQEQTLKRLTKRLSVYSENKAPEREVEVYLKDVSYHVPVIVRGPAIRTVFNANVCYKIYQFFNIYCKESTSDATENSSDNDVSKYRKKRILKDINLVLKPGKSYLILGPPGCGKTTLLKTIAGLSPDDNKKGKPRRSQPHLTGRVEYNGLTTKDDPELVATNVASYVQQRDFHAPYLTVKETFNFALQCRGSNIKTSVENMSTSAKSDKEKFTENMTIEGLGLKKSQDTYVGNDMVRGVSGGQRRRVTVGEMMQSNTPVVCADEISTGLDALTTYDIVRSMVYFAKATKTTRVISLLQPGPETFSLFDEVIILSEGGHLIYVGPNDEVVDYFDDLGYKLPADMDIADFLQIVSTKDGARLFVPSEATADTPYTDEGFVEVFKNSPLGKTVSNQLASPPTYQWCSDESSQTSSSKRRGKVPDDFKKRFRNSFCQSARLNVNRHMTLWLRNRGYIIAQVIMMLALGGTVGGMFWQLGRLPKDAQPVDFTDPDFMDEMYATLSNIKGALFLSLFYFVLEYRTRSTEDIDERAVHYKQSDANFYHPFTFLIGKSTTTILQFLLETTAFIIPFYWMIGFAINAGAFFICVITIFVLGIASKFFFSILVATLRNKSAVQGPGIFFVLLFCLFGGYIVSPKVIPPYYIWFYWINPMAWSFQLLLSNEFTTEKYGEEAGNMILEFYGFQTGREWIGYSFAFMLPFTILSGVVTALCLDFYRVKKRIQVENKEEILTPNSSLDEAIAEVARLPFTPVNLTFENISYEVTASTSDEKLRLLNDVSGSFMSGRMCALMGASGAGKTTLMDVIAMRKTSGDVEGDILLNGFPQERSGFLRCSGYVEQFDIQSPELTVRETIQFSARLRLGHDNADVSDDAGKMAFVESVIRMLELSSLQNSQVGSYEEGGLSFEQRKRLAIATELAGSPSVLFLDEPTSGLDSRAAMLVMTSMKRIANTGRTICATIHQPSSEVFEMFDDILLLKPGGETVFFGELGENSSHLKGYFESHGTSPCEYGENPASWMLKAFTGNNADRHGWSTLFKNSDQYKVAYDQIQEVKDSVNDEMKITDTIYASSFNERLLLTSKRITKIYLRSPAYNYSRLLLSGIYALLIGSVFFIKEHNDPKMWSEEEADAMFGTIFISLLLMGFTSINMAVPVMKNIRDVFYKHKASGMLSYDTLHLSLALAEIPYLFSASFLYTMIYFFCINSFRGWVSFFAFWGYFTFNMAIWSYFGQAFMCLVKPTDVALTLSSALIGLNLFFSGYNPRPQYISIVFKTVIYFSPGRWAYEGCVVRLFRGGTENGMKVMARTSSAFNRYLVSAGVCTINQMEKCTGTANQYVDFYFGGEFNDSATNFWLGLFFLFFYVFVARTLTYLSLRFFDHGNT
mmetsp:Transcript_34485/g.50638  ORF Transcript_34485/g.50638 Transcript_34485/m.50638 type:complete len:1445 (-) Transcript_34485:232-4566(-)